MDERGGWTKAYRRRWENPVFHNKQEAAVWAWMCDIAAHEATTIKTKYGLVHLQRGDILISGRKIAEDFGMSHKQVRNLLGRLTAAGHSNPCMIRLTPAPKGAHSGTIATIVKYNEYQSSSAQPRLPLDPAGHTNGHTAGHSKGTARAQEQRTKEDEGKERVEAPPIVPPVSADFDDDLTVIPFCLDRSEEAEAMRRWNVIAERHDLPLAQKLTDTRKRKLRARLEDCGGLEGWQRALEKVEASPGLLGKNDRKWRADIDFLLQEKSFTRLMEGFYDRWGDGAGKADQDLDSAFDRMDAMVMGDQA